MCFLNFLVLVIQSSDTTGFTYVVGIFFYSSFLFLQAKIDFGFDLHKPVH